MSEGNLSLGNRITAVDQFDSYQSPVISLARRSLALGVRMAPAHQAGHLRFFNDLARLADRDAFATHLAPLRKIEWVVYAKRPFAGPEAVLAYLSRYTHRVAISNSRLIALDDEPGHPPRAPPPSKADRP